ncbi:glutathione S-transferase family protein [Aquabacterium sp. OR-4]|uniref:glutathione S-transferase family protein n=1 Tax=Aquabacterium sp. OR-4 TaxID=2978127 RepID=UPI0028C900E4|nr:glutathione S-transferase family protein [Aquabacterium sp. OR-4]MDT7835751.1 glutathione S-transferase family protein [Aquabacterium sp. OR-4]
MLRVLGQPASINVRKVLWTCAEIGLPIEREDWGGDTRAPTAPGFLALNPNAMVPVIVDGTQVLWESNTICRYLAAQHGRVDLLPNAAGERAKVEQWMDWQIAELNPAWRAAFVALVRGRPVPADEVAASTAQWHRLMALLDAHLGDGRTHVCGEAFTLADVVLGLSANRWHHTPLAGRPGLPAVAAWLARLAQRPACRLHGLNGVA